MAESPVTAPIDGNNEPDELRLESAIELVMSASAAKKSATKDLESAEKALLALNEAMGEPLKRIPDEKLTTSRKSKSTNYGAYKVTLAQAVSIKFDDEEELIAWLDALPQEAQVYIAQALRVVTYQTGGGVSILGTEPTETKRVVVFDYTHFMKLSDEWRVEISKWITRTPGKVGISAVRVDPEKE